MQGSARYPLDGVRVLNFGWIWAGAVVGQMLGDMGAEVIRIESVARPDFSRMQGISNGTVNIGRSQMSATLNTVHQKARDLALELAAISDVVADNYRPGTMQALGLGYEQLKEANPTIIALSASAAGQTGPLSRISTYGSNVSCLGGLDSLQGLGGVPVPGNISLVDPVYANMAVYAILAALRHRELTGEGQFIDLSQWESTVGLVGGPFLDYVMNNRIQGPIGNADPTMAPHGVFPCLGDDRWIAIAVRNDAEWQSLCRTAANRALSDDVRFSDRFKRLRNHEALEESVSAWTRTCDRWELAMALQAKGVPAFPVFSDKDAFEDRHYWERQTWVKSHHPIVGDKTVFGVAWKLLGTPGTMERPAPAMGQDNIPVFCDMLGMDQAELDELVSAKVVH